MNNSNSLIRVLFLYVNNDFKDITNYSLSVDKTKEDFEENHKYIDELNKNYKQTK